MQFIDKETVAGTRVTIGRRVQRRKTGGGGNGEAVVKPSATYTAEYVDASGKRRFEALATTVKREARRKAVEIQSRLDEGLATPTSARTRLTVAQLAERYLAHVEAKGLARKTHARYRVELEKLIEFCREEGVERATQVDEEVFHRFGAFLRSRAHKQSGSGGGHAPKTVYIALTVCKQAYKWAWRVKLLPEFPLASARLPKGKPRPQPCFTTAQVEAMLAATPPDSLLHRAIAILAYSGLRVGELEQLRWEDVRLDVGDLGVIHVRRGGSVPVNDAEDAAPKDKDHRVVPIHPRIRPIIEAMSTERGGAGALVMPDLRARTLLTHLKRLCRECGFPNAERFKTHALRHHFASMCANKGVPYRLVLSWLGHSSSEVADQYYTLFDEESRAAMRALAEKEHAR